MIAQYSRTESQILGFAVTVFFYGLFLWRLVKKNPGNRVIECGSMSIAVLLAFVLLSQATGLPDWIIASLCLLLATLCFATLFFLAQRIFRYFKIRGTRQSRKSSTSRA